MYIELCMVESLLWFCAAMLIFLTVMGAIGWTGYMRLSAEQDKLKKEYSKAVKQIDEYTSIINNIRKRENIKVANEYNQSLKKEKE